MSKDNMDKFENEESKVIKKNRHNWFLKQTVVRVKKPKINRNTLKDKSIRDI